MRLLISLILLACFGAARAEGVLELRRDLGFAYGLDTYLRTQVDPTGTLRFEDLVDQNFQPAATPPVRSFGFSPGAVFVRLIVTNVDSPVHEWVLALSSPMLDRIDVRLSELTASGPRLVQQTVLGDQLPFAQRGIPIFEPNTLLQLAAGRSYQLDFRLSSTSMLRVSSMLTTRAEALRMDTRKQYLSGLYSGLVLALCAFNLMLWFSLRERVVFWFIAHAATYGLLAYVLSGRALAELWPSMPGLNNGAHLACMCLSVYCALRFADAALSLHERRTPWSPVTRYFGWFVIALGILGTLVPWHYWIAMGNLTLVTGAILVAIVSGERAVRGEPIAMGFFVAWCALAITAWMLPAMTFGVAQTGPFSRSALHIGSGIELILMSFLVVDRIRRLRETDQSKLRAAAAELEQRVAARTAELNQTVARLDHANQALKDLSQLDGLTGLADRRRLDQLLKETWQQHLKERFPLVVMMIDLDHFKAINDRYGHLIGDDCLRSLAARLRVAFSGPNEVTARYGGEEFTVILPRCSLEHAHVRAHGFRLEIEQMAVTTQRGPVSITISIGLVSIEAGRAVTIDDLLNRADRALYEAKRQGRNCVVVG